MGADYHVAMHATNWPTMQALQQCIDERKWPLRVGKKDDAGWTKALALMPTTLGLSVTFQGQPIELEASIVTLSPTQSFSYQFDRPLDLKTEGSAGYFLRPEDVLKPVDINETLARIGAAGVRFDSGDRVLTLTFRSNVTEWKAGFYIMAAFIKCFNGYGFELQEGRHGTTDYADALVKEASEP